MKIIGMGNALVDVLALVSDDSLLKELNLPKGSMQLIDSAQRERIFDKIRAMKIEYTSGGSAGNTSKALAKMGETVGFIGKIGNDEYGKIYLNHIEDAGILPHYTVEAASSGTAMTLITPDGERTFGTYLGVAAELSAADLKPEIFSGYDYFYIEGYLVQNYELIESAIAMAKAAGCKVAIDLASYNVVEANRDFLQQMIAKYVDVVFANEEEARALTGEEAEAAVETISKQVKIAVVKVGSRGSYLKRGEEMEHIPVQPVKVVDATAAGDYYAAGFLHGLAQNASLKQCGELGSLLASEIIQVVGTHLEASVWDKIRCQAAEILNDNAK